MEVSLTNNDGWLSPKAWDWIKRQAEKIESSD